MQLHLGAQDIVGIHGAENLFAFAIEKIKRRVIHCYARLLCLEFTCRLQDGVVCMLAAFILARSLGIAL